MKYREEYEHFRKHDLKSTSKPYHFANKDLAEEFFQELQLFYPDAGLYETGSGQCICLDEKAKKKLLKALQSKKKQQEAELRKTEALINELKEGGEA